MPPDALPPGEVVLPSCDLEVAPSTESAPAEGEAPAEEAAVPDETLQALGALGALAGLGGTVRPSAGGGGDWGSRAGHLLQRLQDGRLRRWQAGRWH